MNCPTCSDTVCQSCLDKYGVKTFDGKPLEYGYFSSTEIFYTKVVGSNVYTQDNIGFVNGHKCIIEPTRDSYRDLRIWSLK